MYALCVYIHVTCNTCKAHLGYVQFSGDGVPLAPASRANQGDSYSTTPGITKLISEGGNVVHTLPYWNEVPIKSLKFKKSCKDCGFPAAGWSEWDILWKRKRSWDLLCLTPAGLVTVTLIWYFTLTTYLLMCMVYSKTLMHTLHGRLQRLS